MLPKEFKPTHEYNLIRFGQDNDGGYLVEKNSIETSKCLITLGVGYDWTFEKDYKKSTNCPIYCYDHTVSYSTIKKRCRKFIGSYFFRFFKPKYVFKKNFFKELIKNIFLYKDYKKFFKDNVHHIQKHIGTGKNSLKLKKIIDDKKNDLPAFIKIDIEGSEYRILEELLLYQKSFTGIAIEFHDVDIHIDKIKNFINNLNIKLVHIHGQNPAHIAENDIPTQIEFTFARDPNVTGTNVKFPHKLDQPANPSFKEVELLFEN